MPLYLLPAMTLEVTHLLSAAGGFLGMLMIYRFVSPRVVPLCFPAYTALMLMICHPHFGDVYFLMHHAVSLIAGFFGMAYTSIPYYVNVFLMMEMTNPFVNFRFLLKALGYPEKSVLFSSTGVLIFVTWWIARLAFIPIYAYHMAQLMRTGDFFKIELPMQLTSVLGYAFFTVLNLAWFRVILKLFKREIRGLIELSGHSKRAQLQEANSKKGG